jgi:sugar phosphate isomerase/epimerase
MSASVVVGQIGVSTNICHYSINLLDAVNHLSQHFNIIEIELENQIRHFFESDKYAFVEEIKKLLRLKNRKGLNFCLHAPYVGSETDLSAINPVIRQEALWRMMESIELAVDLGCNNVTYYLHHMNKKLDQNVRLKNLRHALEKVAFYADKLNIKILLEYIPIQTNYHVGFDMADLMSICKEFNFELALNISQYKTVYDSEEWCHNILGSLLPYLGKVYIANTLPSERNIKSGFYYQKLLSYLYQHNFAGPIIIERKNYLSGFGQEDNQLLLATAGLKNDIINFIGQ